MNRSELKKAVAVTLALTATVAVYHRWRDKTEPATLLPLPGDVVDSTANTAPSPPLSAPLPGACRDFHTTACARREITVDPTGIVQPDIKGEVEALRLYERIIHNHPDWTSDEVDEELVAQIYTPRRRKRLIGTFAWVSAAMKVFIDRQPAGVFPQSLKRTLKKRIDETTLELPPPASIYANEPDLFTKNEIYYESFETGRRVVRIGGAYLLSAKSWFNRVFTFAHELAHAIDPCELEAARIDVPAYHRLTRCFHQAGFIRGGTSCKGRTQVGEAFADWVATDIVATAFSQYEPKLEKTEDRLNSAINAVKDLCHQETWEELETDLYPEAVKRIGLIYAGNPMVAAFLGCEAPKHYCTLEAK